MPTGRVLLRRCEAGVHTLGAVGSGNLFAEGLAGTMNGAVVVSDTVPPPPPEASLPPRDALLLLHGMFDLFVAHRKPLVIARGDVEAEDGAMAHANKSRHSMIPPEGARALLLMLGVSGGTKSVRAAVTAALVQTRMPPESAPPDKTDDGTAAQVKLCVSWNAFLSAFVAAARRDYGVPDQGSSATASGASWAPGICAMLRHRFGRLQRLREAFLNIDVDSDGAIEADELRTLFSQLSITLTDEEAMAVQATFDVDGNGEIEFHEFVAAFGADDEEEDKPSEKTGIDGGAQMNPPKKTRIIKGIEAWRDPVTGVGLKPASLHKLQDVLVVSKLARIGSIMDKHKVIAAADSHAVMQSMTRMERVGVGYLERMTKKLDKKGAKKLDKFRKQQARTLEGAALEKSVKERALRLEEKKQGTKARAHTLSPKEAGQLRMLLRIGFFTALCIGGGFALGALVFEKCVTDKYFWEQSGGGTELFEEHNATHTWNVQLTTNILGQCESPTHKAMSWIGYANMAVAMIVSIAEVFFIYRVAFRSALRIVAVTGLQLFPVDRQRAFVTASLVRAALEMDPPAGSFNGINPLRESSQVAMVLAFLAYKLKRGATTFLLKLMIKKVAPRFAAKSALSMVVVVPVNGLWNAFVMRKVLEHAKVVAMGSSASVEVLNNLLDSSSPPHALIVPELAVQLLRAFAMVTVTKGGVHPSVQLLGTSLTDVVVAMWPNELPAFLKQRKIDDAKKTPSCMDKMMNGMVEGGSVRGARLCD